MSKKKFEILGCELADIGFYINLPECGDRRKNIEKQKKKYGIKNLRKVSAERDELHQSSATKSHRKVFEIAKKNNYEVIAVFEDDFQIYDSVYIYDKLTSKPLSEYLVEFSEHIKNFEWDIILLGYNGRKYSTTESKHLCSNYKSTGAWGYLIRKNAYEYILDNFNYYRDRMAIDDLIPYMNYCGFKSMASNVQIVHHATGFISTLNPQGPVNYDSWIEGNYYASLWGSSRPKENDLDKCLVELFKRDKKQRDTYYEIENYDGNYEKLMSFLMSNREIERSHIFVKQNDMIKEILPSINYSFGVESRQLLYVDVFTNKEKIKLPKKVKKINFKKIKLPQYEH